jgi:hypothetical protein
MVYVLLYLLISACIGFLGRKRTLRFLGYFLFSILLTPIGGILLLIPSEEIEPKKKNKGF